MNQLVAPFPYFGGKRRIAAEVWARLGDVANYVEPFFGSGAVLLGRPSSPKIETVNDVDHFIANFWRAVQAAPEVVAHHADWPVNECVPSGTIIATPAGGRVPVERVTAGMTVLGMEGGRVVPVRVIATKRNLANTFVRIGPLRLTGNHPVWTEGSGYLEASRLRPGMRVAVLNSRVDETDLVVLHSPNAPVGNIHVERPKDRQSPLRRDDVSWQETTQRAYVTGSHRREDASRLLDKIADRSRDSTNLQGHRVRDRERLARGGKALDSHPQANVPAGEPHGGRGWDAGLCADTGNAAEVVGDAIRGSVFARPGASDAWQTPHAEISRIDPRILGGAGAQGVCQGEDFCCTEGQKPLTIAPSKAFCFPSRQGALDGAQREDCGSDRQQETCDVCRDGGGIRLHHSGSQEPCSDGIVDQPSNQEGIPLQGDDVALFVEVYNFQTTSGNYFANSVLVHNCDLQSRHYWLLTEGRDRIKRCDGDPRHHDSEVAGYWLWGACAWIGGGWCSGDGPWAWSGDEWRKLPHLGAGGQGIKRKLPHLSGGGRGINRKLPHRSNGGRGDYIREWMQSLADRLRDVRVCCGDWSRVCGDSVTRINGVTGVFLDPPYSVEDRASVYNNESFGISRAVREWALEAGSCPDVRIAICGYDGEHDFPPNWSRYTWKAQGGYGNQSDGQGRANAARETIWFSPACIQPEQSGLFDTSRLNEAYDRRTMGTFAGGAS